MLGTTLKSASQIVRRTRITQPNRSIQLDQTAKQYVHIHYKQVYRMASQAKRVFKLEMDLAKSDYASGHWATAIHHLERAHIVGQRYFWAHLSTHLWMLRIAFLRQDLSEGIGQFTRILAVVPGYIFGWVPVGNTGGTNASPIKPMPIPQDLESCFVRYSLRRQIMWRLVVVALLLLVAWRC
ncbi:DUF3703 domain-containing protein [Pseudomonas sp. ANT_J12]|uniref:DUF3703 domain-containing protein n=1 Tax=Pseudomonas sp. ANT_J12 TaxID=2597351 RepID=UPI001C4982FB|nr:DUF3703 domain-containing protein [Pseudomonas sp. ANT_J12]